MYKVEQHKKPVTFFGALKDLVLGLFDLKGRTTRIGYFYGLAGMILVTSISYLFVLNAVIGRYATLYYSRSYPMWDSLGGLSLLFNANRYAPNEYAIFMLVSFVLGLMNIASLIRRLNDVGVDKTLKRTIMGFMYVNLVFSIAEPLRSTLIATPIGLQMYAVFYFVMSLVAFVLTFQRSDLFMKKVVDLRIDNELYPFIAELPDEYPVQHETVSEKQEVAVSDDSNSPVEEKVVEAVE